MPRIRLSGDELSFSAAHFITFDDGTCERLHGHTYRVAAEVSGPLNACGYVVDFIAVRQALKEILAELDHHVLLPAQSPTIRVSRTAGAVEVVHAARRWLFPEDDCVLIPIANTTSELLAQHIAQRLAAALGSLGLPAPTHIQIELAESTGCSAVCDLPSGP